MLLLQNIRVTHELLHSTSIAFMSQPWKKIIYLDNKKNIFGSEHFYLEITYTRIMSNLHLALKLSTGLGDSSDTIYSPLSHCSYCSCCCYSCTCFSLKHEVYSFYVDISFAISKRNIKILPVAFSSLSHTLSVLVTALSWGGCRRRVESYKCSSRSDCSHSSGCVLTGMVCCHLQPDCYQCEIRQRDTQLQVRMILCLVSARNDGVCEWRVKMLKMVQLFTLSIELCNSK